MHSHAAYLFTQTARKLPGMGVDHLCRLASDLITLTHGGVLRPRRPGLRDCMWVSFDPRERSICGLATVVGGRGAMVGGASKSCKTCTTVAALTAIISILF